MSNKLPPISDDIRQPPKKLSLNLKPREHLSDDVVEAHSREIGEQWGSSTQLQLASKEIQLEEKARAPLVSIRFDSPDYLDKALSVMAAEQGVTKTYLILQSLKNAGYRLDEADLVTDRRRWKKR